MVGEGSLHPHRPIINRIVATLQEILTVSLLAVGLSVFRCKWLVASFYSVGKIRPSNVMAKAFRAGFHRFIQRFGPFPVGSRLRTAR
jgi:hypothetical protein